MYHRAQMLLLRPKVNDRKSKGLIAIEQHASSNMNVDSIIPFEIGLRTRPLAICSL